MKFEVILEPTIEKMGNFGEFGKLNLPFEPYMHMLNGKWPQICQIKTL